MIKHFANLQKKTSNILRRWQLGAAYKHQYNCHPDFSLHRDTTYCTVIWKQQPIAKIPFAHTLSKQYTGPCWVIASGPSLAEFDLQQVANYPTLSLNCAIKKFTASGLCPTYSIIVDHRVFERQWACVEASVKLGAICFFNFEGLSIIAERAPELLKRGNIYLIESISRKFGVARDSTAAFLDKYAHDPEILLSDELLSYCRSIGFSLDLQKGVFAGKTVATWAVQLAFGLGHQAIYIVGMDLGGTGKAHFYADKHNAHPDFQRYYEPHIRGCFELARRASDKTGVKLYNLSRHSALPDEIVPKISLDLVLQQIAEAATHKPTTDL